MAITFYDFLLVYPKRKGANPKALARTKWDKAIKEGADPEHLVSSAKRYGDELRAQGKYDTEFVCMAATWLNQKRWLDYQPDPESKERDAKIDADMKKRGYIWNGNKWERINPDGTIVKITPMAHP